MIDMRTVFVVQILVLLVCFFILLNAWLQNKSRYKGLGFWTEMMGASSLGYFLLALRDYIPDIISVIFANLLLVVAFVLFNWGIILFYQLKSSIVPSVTIVAIVMVLQVLFTYTAPDIHARIIVISAAFVIIYGRSLWLLLFCIEPKHRSISKGLIWNVVGIIILNVFRIVIHLLESPSQGDLFEQSWGENLFLILQVPIILFLVLNIVLMISRSLMSEVRDEEAKFNSIFHFAPYAVIITKLEDATVLEANEEMLKLLEYEPNEMIGETLLNLGTWIDTESRTSMIEELKTGGHISGRELTFRTKTGKFVPVLFSANLISIGGDEYIVSSMKDISEINRLKTELMVMATHDMLTGLPNRRKFHEICMLHIARASRSGEKLAMVIFDVDDFKLVNDQFGHNVGDKVLVAIADRLREFSRLGENIARHGGDEFTLLLVGLKDEVEAEAALSRLYKMYEEPVTIEGLTFNISLSMGVAMFPDNGLTTEELLRRADAALYEVKRRGKNSVRFASEPE